MAEALIERVRSFNPAVTQRVGALHEEYLARSRPLGASRVLWEIDAGTEIRAIRLDLDSGYLSRLLRRLEAEGWSRSNRSPAIAGPGASGSRPPVLASAPSWTAAAMTWRVPCSRRCRRRSAPGWSRPWRRWSGC